MTVARHEGSLLQQAVLKNTVEVRSKIRHETIFGRIKQSITAIRVPE